MNNSLLLCLKFAQHWGSAILKCNHQHSPANMHKTLQLHAWCMLLKAMWISNMWDRTKGTAAYLEGMPPTNAPLKTKPSSSLRFTFVLDMGLAFAES